MAKRFTDTDKWKKKWFRELGSHLRDVRQFILDDCDLAGIWEIDLDRVAYHIGEKVSLEDIQKAFNFEVEVLLGADSIHIPPFIEFQYGTLVDTNNAHRAVLKRLRSKKVQPLTSPSRGVQDKDKEKDQDKDQDQDKEGGVGDFRKPLTSQEVDACMDDWRDTLLHFEIDRRLGERDQIEIARAVQQFGAEWVKLAFAGARKQKAGKTFDPKQFVSLRIYLDPKRIERLVNIGAGKESVEGIDWTKVFGKAS